jgi:hypothetical protein
MSGTSMLSVLQIGHHGDKVIILDEVLQTSEGILCRTFPLGRPYSLYSLLQLVQQREPKNETLSVLVILNLAPYVLLFGCEV